MNLKLTRLVNLGGLVRVLGSRRINNLKGWGPLQEATHPLK